MWSISRMTLIQGLENACSVIKETKRLAGHSKWANIRHTKAIKDGEKATMFSKFARQMRVAIAEEGSYKPTENSRLAQIIEQAKKKSMPIASIKNVLDKASKATTITETTTVDVRGPGGCIIIIELIADNMTGTKMLINNVIKKNKSTLADQSARNVFHHRGSIVTELTKNLDAATEDAIAIGADDVEEIELDGSKFLHFTCEARVLAKVANQLAGRDYKIISREDQYIPHVFANLSDVEIDRATVLYAKLEALEEVVRIHDNIA